MEKKIIDKKLIRFLEYWKIIHRVSYPFSKVKSNVLKFNDCFFSVDLNNIQILMEYHQENANKVNKKILNKSILHILF